MAKMRKALALLLALTLVLSLGITGLVLPATAEQEVALVPNGDFELGVTAPFDSATVTDGVGYGGGKAMEIGAGSSTTQMNWDVTLKANTVYAFTFMAKGPVLQVGLNSADKLSDITLRIAGSTGSTSFKTTDYQQNSVSEWVQYRFLLITGENPVVSKTATFFFKHSNSSETESTYVDNVSVTEFDAEDERMLGTDFDVVGQQWMTLKDKFSVDTDTTDGNKSLYFAPSTSNLGGYIDCVDLDYSTQYALTFRVKGAPISVFFYGSKGCLAGIKAGDNNGSIGWLATSQCSEWTQYTYYFSTNTEDYFNEKNNKTQDNMIQFGRYTNKSATLNTTEGTYIDDISIKKVLASGIVLDQTTASVDLNKTVTLTVSGTPAGVETPAVTWTSDDETVATVKEGVVTGLKEGTVTITATAEGLTPATCEVTVVDPAKIFSEYFEGATTAAAISNWVKKGEVTADPTVDEPTDDTNKVLRLTSAASTTWSGGAFGFAANKMYLLSVKFYGAENLNANIHLSTDSTKGIINNVSNAVAMNGSWQTVNYILKMSSTVKNDGYTLALTASAGVYMDDLTITEIAYDDNLVIGGDFETEGYHAHSGWYSMLSSGYFTRTVDPDDESNHVLYMSEIPDPSADVAFYYKGGMGVEANTSYELTMKVKGGNFQVLFLGGKNVKGNVGWNVVNVGETDTWQEVTLPFTTNEKAEQTGYVFGFGIPGVSSSTGAYIDDVKIKKTGYAADADSALENGTIHLTTDLMNEEKQTSAGAAAGDIVTVTVAPAEGYVMVPGTLKYTGVTSGTTEVKILNETWETRPEWGRESAGNTFEFEMPDEPVTVTAEFVSTATQNFQMDSIGTAIRENGETDENGNTYYGIRFLTRMNLATTFDPETAGLSVTIDGAAHKVLKIGSKLTRDADGYEWDAVVYEEGGNMKLVDYTDSYIDFASVMKTVNIERTYTAQGYIVVDLDDDGVIDESEYIYSTHTQNDSVKTTAERLGITLNGTAQ